MGKFESGIHMAADRAWAKANKVYPEPTWREQTISAADLQKKTFPPIKYVVKGLLPEGLGMLAGRPKIGKSWAALDIGSAVASADGTCLGGLEVEHGDVLYCALEDSHRRLQSRLTKLLGVFKDEWPRRLQLTTSWRRLDKGGVSDIAEWVRSVPDPRLVILDTLASVKPLRTTEGYQQDYQSLEQLHRLANDIGIAILVLHHQRKSDAEDPLDTISGTLGLAGCVDTPLILSGTSQGMSLYVRGRDIEEAEHAIVFDKATARWSIKGDAALVRVGDTRKKILEALETAKEKAAKQKSKDPKSKHSDPEAAAALSPQEVGAIAGLNDELTRQTLARMAADGLIEKVGRGQYRAK